MESKPECKFCSDYKLVKKRKVNKSPDSKLRSRYEALFHHRYIELGTGALRGSMTLGPYTLRYCPTCGTKLPR